MKATNLRHKRQVEFQLRAVCDEESDRNAARNNAGREEFSDTPEGEEARYRWAERYDELNGAPESDGDR